MYTPLVQTAAGGGRSLPLWKSILCIFAPSLIAFIILDGIWIGLVASDFYMTRSVGHHTYTCCEADAGVQPASLNGRLWHQMLLLCYDQAFV